MLRINSSGLTWIKSKEASATQGSAFKGVSGLTVTASSLKIEIRTPFDSVRPLVFPPHLQRWFHIVLSCCCVGKIHLDMVAEPDRDSGLSSFATSICLVKSVTTTQTTTRPLINQITSSSEEERPHWSSKLQEESDIKLRCSPMIQSQTQDSCHQPHLTESSRHMSNCQKTCSRASQSLTATNYHVPLSH